MNKIIKVVLSLVVALCAIYPYLNASEGSGAVETILETKIAVSIILMLAFFTAIAFYCYDLEKCLTLISTQNRAARPKSVWYMFLIPYNIIEDFFIIINVSISIDNEARSNASISKLNNNGLVTGMGWCIAQVLSLIPNAGGQIAGAVALVLWIMHWHFIRKTNSLLKKKNDVHLPNAII